MGMLPFGLFLSFLGSLLSTLILFGGIYIFYEWYRGVFTGILILLLSIFLLFVTFFGKFILALFFKKTADAPEKLTPQSFEDIVMPDGAKLRVNYFGDSRKPTLLLVHASGVDTITK
jgi:hypothetical protein